MSKIIIAPNPTAKKTVPEGITCIPVAEFFCDTIQGEGIHTGVPAAFLRVSGCALNCKWCDSRHIWKNGNRYTVDELLQLCEAADLVDKFRNGMHLVLTGGSPLLYQKELAFFLYCFKIRYNFIPYIEVENECMVDILSEFSQYVKCWNNSPKLPSSGVDFSKAYNPTLILRASQEKNAWFKFVVQDEQDWNVINSLYLQKSLIRREQVILMPLGANRYELECNEENILRLAIEKNVRFCTRLHVKMWDAKISV